MRIFRKTGKARFKITALTILGIIGLALLLYWRGFRPPFRCYSNRAAARQALRFR